MKKMANCLNRRSFLKLSAITAVGATLIPFSSGAVNYLPPPIKRRFGKFDFDVTTIGLGGQAALQWTPEGTDPVKIILKAFEVGINYFDTSNLYDESQLNYGKAFRELKLIPGQDDYNERLRDSVFITSKTHIRWAKGDYPEIDGVKNRTQGDHGGGAVADLKRSLSQLFGNNDGTYPEGAYLDMIMIHNITTLEEVEVLYKGLESPVKKDENFGALIALRDFRDGSNYSGLNPRREKLVKHIGFSGHRSAPVMIEMIQRDEFNVLEAMLVAINVNDKKMLNMQHNVIPVAIAKELAIIGMKVFADGAMYDKEARWSKDPTDVVKLVGSKKLPSRPLVEYALTTPGVDTVIIGIGHIDEDPAKCQIVQNFYAAQISPNGMSAEERKKAEELGNIPKDGNTNYFQLEALGLTPPQNIQFKQIGSTVNLCWSMAYAGEYPISHYEILKNNEKVYQIDHKPLTTKVKMNYLDTSAHEGDKYLVVTVDDAGRRKESELFII